MKVLVVFVALALASASAGFLPKEKFAHPRDLPAVNSIEGRITNGKSAYEGQFPYQAALSFSSTAGSWFCGGSLIAPTWILTAAHCTDGATSATVALGSTVRTSPKHSVTVSSGSFSQHPNYNSVILRNDISLIKIPAVAYTNNINEVALPKAASSYSTYAGDMATASGFGKTSDSTNSVASTLNYANLEVITNALCANTYGSLTITNGVICTATPNKVSTCSGDSGGPLVLDSTKQIIGVVSFVSSAGCESGAPAGYARVTYQLDWIKSITGL
ncbi:hypothetical protein KR009_010599 [Drosophila setifemur]|nr:hypothetical protein KR009_010599 [Drosophila setifemur]